MNWDIDALKRMPTLAKSVCADLKVETPALRVWLCRAGGGVTIEQYQQRTGSFHLVTGGCKTKELKK